MEVVRSFWNRDLSHSPDELGLALGSKKIFEIGTGRTTSRVLRRVGFEACERRESLVVGRSGGIGGTGQTGSADIGR